MMQKEIGKFKKNSMPLFFLLVPLMILFIQSCLRFSSEKTKYNHIDCAYVINSNFPQLNFDSLNKIWVVSNYDPYFCRGYHIGNDLILQKNYYYREIVSKGDSEIISPRISRFHTIVISQSKKSAVIYDSTNTNNFRIVDKDSIIEKIYTPYTFGNDSLFIKNNYTLLSTKKNSTNEVVEVYSLENIIDTTMKGIVEIVFAPFNHCNTNEIRLAPQLERKKNMQVLSISIKNFERKIPGAGYGIGEAELYFGIKSLKENNDTRLHELLIHSKKILVR